MNEAVELILSGKELKGDSKLSLSAEKLISMGFGVVDAFESLQKNANNFEKTITFLLGEREELERQTSATSLQDAILSTEFDLEAPSNLLERIVHTSLQLRSNFFVAMYLFLKERLKNYTGYCVICSRPHTCVSNCPVVCCEPLCVFSYDDGKLGDLIETKLCPFEDCEFCEEKKDISFQKTLKELITLDKNIVGNSMSKLLEMARHKCETPKFFFSFMEILLFSKRLALRIHLQVCHGGTPAELCQNQIHHERAQSSSLLKI